MKFSKPKEVEEKWRITVYVICDDHDKGGLEEFDRLTEEEYNILGVLTDSENGYAWMRMNPTEDELEDICYLVKKLNETLSVRYDLSICERREITTVSELEEV